jgi:hypothetical protein
MEPRIARILTDGRGWIIERALPIKAAGDAKGVIFRYSASQ